MTIAQFLTDLCEDALLVSACLAFGYITLGNLFGHGFYAHAAHELHHAFVFASGLAIGLCLKRGQ